MKKFTILFAALILTATISFGQHEIQYDQGVVNDWQVYAPDRVFAVHFSPIGPCQVIKLRFYLKKEGLQEGLFSGFLYEWEGSQPATDAVFEQASVVVEQYWKDMLVPGIDFSGDFVVGYSPHDVSAFLGLDITIQNGRNWIMDMTDATWSEETSHAYVIRAVVMYTTGEIEELEGTSISIYPNPATNVLNIDVSGNMQKLTLINPAGQIVFSQEVDAGITSIDLNNLDKGLYFVRIENENNTTTRKIIIQ